MNFALTIGEQWNSLFVLASRLWSTIEFWYVIIFWIYGLLQICFWKESSSLYCWIYSRCNAYFNSHLTRRTSHVTRHTSPVTRHTSHITRTSPVAQFRLQQCGNSFNERSQCSSGSYCFENIEVVFACSWLHYTSHSFNCHFTSQSSLRRILMLNNWFCAIHDCSFSCDECCSNVVYFVGRAVSGEDSIETLSSRAG